VLAQTLKGAESLVGINEFSEQIPVTFRKLWITNPINPGLPQEVDAAPDKPSPQDLGEQFALGLLTESEFLV
jgi:hypothetical protein